MGAPLSFMQLPAQGRAMQPDTGVKTQGMSKSNTPGNSSLVFDRTNLLTSSSERYLNTLLRRLEADTKIKFRVVCPPNGIIQNRETWKQFSTPIFREMMVDQSSLVLIAEQQVGASLQDG